MKKIFALALAVASFLFVSCNEKKIQVPEFPGLTEEFINPGEYTVLSFHANMDWKISMPLSLSDRFYFFDGQKSYKMSGMEGDVTIEIHAESIKNNYEIITCPVTLEMGGEQKVIANISINPLTRDIQIYSAEFDDKGSLVATGTGDFEYETSATSSLSLTWPSGYSSYILPIKVAANFDWAVRNDYPDWMDLTTTSSDKGTTTLQIKGVPSHYPLEDASGKITFVDLNEQIPIKEITINIKGCKDMLRINSNTKHFEFNIIGQSSATAFLTGTREAGVIATADWLKIETAFDTNSKDVIIEKTITIHAEQNNGAQREASLLALPGYIMSTINSVDDILDASKTAVASEYEKYIFATASQAGMDPEQNWNALMPANSGYTMAVKGGWIERTAQSDPLYSQLSSTYSTTEIYTVRYNNGFSFENVDIFCKDGFDQVVYSREGVESGEDDRLEIERNFSDEKLFQVQLKYFDDGDDDYEDDFFEDGYESSVVLKKNKKTVAVIICRLSSDFWPELTYDDIRFTILDSNEGEASEEMTTTAILGKLESGELHDKFASLGIPVWQLTYPYETSIRNAMIYVPPFNSENPSSISISDEGKGWLSAEGGISENNKVYIHVRMSNENPEKGNKAYLTLYAGGKPVFALECIRGFLNN